MSLDGGDCGACEGFGVVWEDGREWLCRVCKGTGDKPDAITASDAKHPSNARAPKSISEVSLMTDQPEKTGCEKCIAAGLDSSRCPFCKNVEIRDMVRSQARGAAAQEAPKHSEYCEHGDPCPVCHPVHPFQLSPEVRSKPCGFYLMDGTCDLDKSDPLHKCKCTDKPHPADWFCHPYQDTTESYEDECEQYASDMRDLRFDDTSLRSVAEAKEERQ
jgi:hypothetical protein